MGESKSVLSFHHVGPGDETQVIRFGIKHLYPLSHPADPIIVIVIVIILVIIIIKQFLDMLNLWLVQELNRPVYFLLNPFSQSTVSTCMFRLVLG